ncbi:hypothetical protein EDD11_004870 [Mortierella claussenii]|nr:hypothetical protein EDD11_004870 [Mortierella claussenii]
MLSLVFLVLSGVVAVQTKPKQETFVPFLTSQRKSRIAAASGISVTSGTATTASGRGGGSSVSGWFTRNILEPIAGPRVPQYTINDYYFFLMATLNDGSGTYIGMFHQWWVLSELQEVSGSSSSGGSAGGGSGGNIHEAQAESRKQEAVEAKIKKDYYGAAKAYIDTAKLYEKSGSQFNLMEAAGAYEDAFKAYNMVKQTGPAIQCLDQAARLFKSNDRGGSRAAKIYSQMGDLLKTQDAKRAADLYKEAAGLFQIEGDGRFLQATVHQAEQLCILNEFSRAYSLYKDTIIPETMSQEILRYNARDHILNAIVAHLGATGGDWIVFEQDVVYFGDLCPDFGVSPGVMVLKKLAKAEREHDAALFQEACQEFNRLKSTGMLDWQVGLLLQEKRKLEDGDLL